jgi:CRP-like cAMP-binding protein
MAGLNELMSALPAEKSLEDLKNESSLNTYKKKQIIYKEGAHAHYLYYIRKGRIKTYKTHEDGNDLVMDLYNEGDFLGYVSLIEGTTHKESAETLEETELVLILKKDFEQLINSNPETAKKFIGLLAKNLIEKEEHLLGIAYNTLRKKVAGALLSLLKKYHNNKAEQYQIDVSREELATIAGTATESLTRTLGDFKCENLVDIKKGKVIITNQKKLESLIR